MSLSRSPHTPLNTECAVILIKPTLPHSAYSLKKQGGTSLVVQWLRRRPTTAGGTDSIPGGGTKIPHAVWCGQK